MRANYQPSDQESSDLEETSDGYSTDDLWQQRDGKTKRHQLHHPRRDGFRSPSPFHEWEEGIETTPPSQSQTSAKETDSQLPYSEGPDSQSEVDWEALLSDDIEMLPESNWEADFLVHQAQIMGCVNYKSLGHDEFIQYNGEEPWHPYDPESIHIDGHDELHTDSVDAEMEGDTIVCYGVVSF